MTSQSNEQTVNSARERIAELKEAYMSAVRTVVLEKERDKNSVTSAQILEAHSAAVTYFNYVETFVGSSGLLGAHDNAFWITGFSEDCHAILESVLYHYNFIESYADVLGALKKDVLPSATSYANMQRLVVKYLDGTISNTLKRKYQLANLPIYGFKNEAKEFMSRKLQTILSFIFGVLFVVVLLSIALLKPNPSDFQLFVFRVVLSLAGGGVVAVFPGFIEIKLGAWLRAGGALAVFVLIYFWNPASLVVKMEQPKSPATIQPKEK